MNSLVALVIAVIVAVGGYKTYATWVDRNIIKSDPKKATPAKMYMDGVDFTPANRNVLFGYQFKSIAATGPITGAIIAAQWGWLPALLWLLFGVLLIGWLHDYGSTIISVRNDGQTFGGLSYRLISPRARVILLSFIYFYLLIIAGAFGNLISRTMTDSTIPLGIIVVVLAGFLAGQMIYKWKQDIILTTIVTAGVSLIGIWVGTLSSVASVFAALPNDASAPLFGTITWSIFVWAILMAVFCYVSAVLPIWRFAQPINFVSFWIVAVAFIIGAIGIAVGHPDFTIPATTTWDVGTGGSIMALWPLLFVTIACGAVSGWHSLVSSSGTARQLENETDALPVAGGSMFAEMVMGVIALATAAATYATYGDYVKQVGNPAVIFGQGMGQFMAFVGVPAAFGRAFALIVFVILMVTVLQLVIRFMRVAMTELIGDEVPAVRNAHVGSVIALLLTLFLVFTGTFTYLWQVFGGANQLMAALALLLISLWLIAQQRSATFALVPMVFMLVTTIAALLVTAYNLLIARVYNVLSAGKPITTMDLAGNLVMGVVAVILVVLAILLAIEAYQAVARTRTAKATLKPGEQTA